VSELAFCLMYLKSGMDVILLSEMLYWFYGDKRYEIEECWTSPRFVSFDITFAERLFYKFDRDKSDLYIQHSMANRHNDSDFKHQTG